MSKSRILNEANMSFNAIREDKIIAKIFEFTVSDFQYIQSIQWLVCMNLLGWG